ncbi:MAG: hypothetical protein AAF726_00690 [Planctomycetota bacterium]
MLILFAVTVLPAPIPSAAGPSLAEPRLVEVSGVAHHDGTLYFVGDHEGSARAWFTSSDFGSEPGEHVLGEARLVRIEMSANEKHARQLEDIALAGETVLVLSESSGRILDRKGTLVELPAAMKEVKVDGTSVGPEGLASRDDGDGWRLVVAQQGGKGQPVRLLEHYLSGRALEERWRVELRGAVPVEVSQERLAAHFAATLPDERPIETGRKHHYVRVPGIEWIRLPDRSWGYIVIAAVRRGKDDRRPYLLRLGSDGSPVGTPLDLEAFGIGSRRWEGLCWIGERTVLLVADNDDRGPTFTAILELPSDWFGPR